MPISSRAWNMGANRKSRDRLCLLSLAYKHVFFQRTLPVAEPSQTKLFLSFGFLIHRPEARPAGTIRRLDAPGFA